MTELARELTTVGTTPDNKLGEKLERGGKTYRYAKLDTTMTAAGAAGTVVYHTLASKWVVTDDVSATHFNMIAGVLLGAVSTSNYCWMQTGGRNSAVKTNGDDDITTGDALIGDTTDGVCDSVDTGTAPGYKILGFATSVDDNAADTVPADLVLDE